MSDETVSLSKDEADLLAIRMVVYQIDERDEWLLWEDVPNLDEASFDALVEAVKVVGEQMAKGLRHAEIDLDIDSAQLFGRLG